MSTPTAIPASSDWTAADIVEQFGPIPLWRIRQNPAPGAASEQDVVEIHEREKRLCELVDGVLLEKTVGVQESYVAVVIAGLIGRFVAEQDLGIALGSDGMARLAPGLVRIPDVSFVSWARLGGHEVPALSMLQGGPDLAVEVISPGNTQKEMHRKLRDYFECGVRSVWYVNPRSRSVEVFSDVDQSVSLNETDTLDGGDVLPGFSLTVSELFSKLNQQKQ